MWENDLTIRDAEPTNKLPRVFERKGTSVSSNFIALFISKRRVYALRDVKIIKTREGMGHSRQKKNTVVKVKNEHHARSILKTA